MLGHRGCRLGITFPEIYEMQVRAIMEAACEVGRRGLHVEPEIMIPLTGTVAEMKLTREMTVRVAEQVLTETGQKVAVFGGHDDRGAPGGAGGRQDRGARGFLLVRHQ